MSGPFTPFTISRLPRILFGEGALAGLPDEVAALGSRVLIVTGKRSFKDSLHWRRLTAGLDARSIAFEGVSIAGEPSPELVDAVAAEWRTFGAEVVLGIGGGSAMDAAKAIAGLLNAGRSVMDYLEGVGPELPYEGPAVPLILAPTTAGTGSEATKNAVLSRQGADGFKKSFRHEMLVARVAVVDPEPLATCPTTVMAADGMDAFTQLLESYVSLKANPMTEALAWSGLEAAVEGLFPSLEGKAPGRRRMAYASLVSGICLAQTGLGSVHGMASPLGAFFPIPHGVVCGTLLAEATNVNIAALKTRNPDSPALAKYARVGKLLAGDVHMKRDESLEALVATLRHWTERARIERLGAYGVSPGDVTRVTANSRGSSMKTNPLVLEDEEIAEIIRRRL